MILPLIRELNQICRSPKLDQAQRDRVYSLMRLLREQGFTNLDLVRIVKGRISEPSIKRNTRGVKVKDTVEHDKILEALSDFADGEYELDDIGAWKKAKTSLDKVNLTFEGCASFAEEIFRLGVDAGGLLKLSNELTKEGLTGKAIRETIDLNKELANAHVTKDAQIQILAAAKKYGEPTSLLRVVNVAGDLKALLKESTQLETEVSRRREEEEIARWEGKRLEEENKAFKGYIDIVRLLVRKFSFDASSMNELLELAQRFGNPQNIIIGMKVYSNLEELQAKLRETLSKLAAAEGDLERKEKTLKEKEDRLGEMAQLQQSIMDNHSRSTRLQVLSDLIVRPREVRAPIDEAAKIVLAVLMGLKQYTEQIDTGKFHLKVGYWMDSLIKAFQDYLR